MQSQAFTAGSCLAGSHCRGGRKTNSQSKYSSIKDPLISLKSENKSSYFNMLKCRLQVYSDTLQSCILGDCVALKTQQQFVVSGSLSVTSLDSLWIGGPRGKKG